MYIQISTLYGKSLWFLSKRQTKYRTPTLKRGTQTYLLSMAQESTPQFIMEMIEGSGIFTRWDMLNFEPIKGHLRS